MAKSYRSGQTVTWKWGQGTAEGKVTKVSHERTEVTSKGKTIAKNGTDENPAITIEQDDGTKLVKLASELQ